jgi:hypothetical protein
MNTTQKTFPCNRCSGTGEIRAFGHVMGGVCFKCGGKGTQTSRPAKPQPKFGVTAILKDTGQRISVFFLTAPNAEKALIRARVQLARSAYLPESAEVTSENV